jgi:magnesium transporter
MANAITEYTCFLSEIAGRKVTLNGKKVGKLEDLVIQEKGVLPEITHLVVSRSFGYRSLLVPWGKVAVLDDQEIVIALENLTDYEKAPEPSWVVLKDFILDKKVLDLEGNEVEVVYDVRLAARDGRLYATEVDYSRFGLLRRIGLKRLANFFRSVDKSDKDTISWTYIQPLPENIGSFKGNVRLKVLKEKISEIHPVDLADILEELDHPQRLAIFNELGTEQASDTLEEVEPRVQRDLISSIKKERAAELINDMTPAQAADILAILPTDEAEDILKLIDKESAQKVQFLMDKHSENVLNFITPHILKYPPDTTVNQVLDSFRYDARDKDVIMYLYIVDEGDKLLGVIDLRELLQANPDDRIGDLMTPNVISMNPESTLIEASELFSRYSFRAIPITDENDKILGVIPYRDIMDLKHRFV